MRTDRALRAPPLPRCGGTGSDQDGIQYSLGCLNSSPGVNRTGLRVCGRTSRLTLRRWMRMRWKALTTLIVVAVLFQIMAIQTPASEQLLPPTRNSFSLGIGTVTPAVYTLGMAWPGAPAWGV